MPARHNTLKIKALLLVLIGVVSLSACQPSTTPEDSQTAQITPTTQVETNQDQSSDDPQEAAEAGLPEIIDDYEDVTLVSGRDVYAEIGFVTWSDGSEVSLEIVEYGAEVSPPEALPESTRGLAVSINISSGGWGGMSHTFTNQSADLWLSQDWSAFEGISFWVYGRETGGTLLFEILENRNPDSEVDDAERWNYTFYDDFNGWQFFEVPFTEFNRKDIGNGAPNDGMELVEVHGYAFGGFGAIEIGSQTYYLDDVRLYGVAPEKPLLFNFDKQIYQAREGGLSRVTVELNKPADTSASIDFSVTEGYAVLGQDFTVETGTLTFAPGETQKTFEIVTIDDAIAEEHELVTITLHNPVGAGLGPFRRAVFMIRDDDPADPNLIFDFESYPGLVAAPGTTLTLNPLQDTDPLALPDQNGLDTVLQAAAAGTGAAFSRRFALAQDWSAYSGIQFWMYGSNSGDRVETSLLLNKTESSSGELELVWSDEFEGAANQSPDWFIWKPELGDGRLNGLEGWGNAELEHYSASPENAALDGNGNLVITAREVDTAESPLQCWYGSCEYTSARLITSQRVEFQYGRIEARIKLPVGQGLWPAFWMLGNNIGEVGWPQSGEIDIMEYLGRKPDTVIGALHGPGYSGAANLGAEVVLPEGDFSEEFHIFAIDWEPGQIVWTMDGTPFHSVTPQDLPEGGEWVFNQPGFIILNLAVGGNYPGNPDASTSFPAAMLVDYVRVYQRPTSFNRVSFTVTDDFQGWQLIRIPFSDMTPSLESGEPSAVWGFSFTLDGFTQNHLMIDDLGFFIEEQE